MEKETKVALQESIEHWERLRDGTQRRGETTGVLDCALCQRFYPSCQRRNEELCPVYMSTGWSLCRKSPYKKATVAFHNNFKKAERYNLINAEVQFLKSLLPKE